MPLPQSQGAGWRPLGRRLLTSLGTVPDGVIGVAIAVLVFTSQQWGLLQPLELGIYDYWVRQHPAQLSALVQPLVPSTPEIVVIGITEDDIQEHGQWPLSDQVLAQLLARLQRQAPRAIGIDLHRDIAYPPGHDALARQLKAQNVFAIESLIDGIPPPPDMALEQVGFNDLLVDTDGIVRRNFLYATLGDDAYYSLGLKMALFVLNQQVSRATQSAVWIGSVPIPALTANAGGYSQVDAAGYQTLLQYNPQGFRQVSLNDVLTGQADEWIRDKIVLVGTVAPSIKDTFFTPFSAVQDEQPLTPGVVIHAHNLQQIMRLVQAQTRAIGWSPNYLEGLWILLWSVLGGCIAWRCRQPRWMVVLTGVATLGLIGLGGIALSYHYWLVLAAPALGLLLSLLLSTVYKIFYYSFYDPMTQLPNRALFLRRLQPLLQEQPRSTLKPPSPELYLAVLFIDIDEFKSLNESLGQESGNRILRQVAQQLKQILPGKTVARIGGDEFAFLLPRMDHAQDAEETAAQLQKLLAQPNSSLVHPLVITVSIGIALYQTGASYRAADLLQDAHRATYRAKQMGRERYEVFARGMRTQAVSKFQLEMDLRQAIEQEEFELYYQPIVDLKSGQVAGFEALLRWIHEERGFVSPGEFIPLAEETGLIIPLGQWVLTTACQQIQRWHQAFVSNPPLSVSVNLSARQFNQSDLVEKIHTLLQQTRLQPEGLKLELTESVAMENVNLAIEQLLKLRKMGLKISLDDFGTGYSSLSYLHRFSIDTLKVDRSFVSRMDTATEDRDIAHTIITLSHQLGMTVVAEGIETQAQLQKLRDMGCDYGQGYFFAKPLTAAKATELLQQPAQW
ncbi:MAG: EAL domain-containing protein [Cyanobacteria bacterium P01_A01_bin.105]